MTDKYDQLFQAWRLEKENEELQQLPDHFLAEMDDYTITLNKSNLEGISLKEKITKQESDQANKMLKGLTKLRLVKIVKAELELTPINAAHLTTGEKRLHANLRQLLSDYTNRALQQQTDPIPIKQKPRSILTSEKKEKNYMVLRFIKPLPAIMGTDLKAYGPFKAEDVASIPHENALNLIRRGIAKEVKLPNPRALKRCTPIKSEAPTVCFWLSFMESVGAKIACARSTPRVPVFGAPVVVPSGTSAAQFAPLTAGFGTQFTGGPMPNAAAPNTAKASS